MKAHAKLVVIAAHIDDLAARFRQIRIGLPAGGEYGCCVDAEQLFEGVGRVIRTFAFVVLAGIIDQQINPPEAIMDRFECGFQGSVITHITGKICGIGGLFCRASRSSGPKPLRDRQATR